MLCKLAFELCFCFSMVCSKHFCLLILVLNVRKMYKYVYILIPNHIQKYRCFIIHTLLVNILSIQFEYKGEKSSPLVLNIVS